MGSKKAVTIGYRYYLGMHMILSLVVDEIQKIIVGERVAWSGSVKTNQSIYINSPELFGGEKKEGGIQGSVDVLMGGPAQPKNGYLMSKLGSNIPAFRGVTSLVVKGAYVAAMSPYPKQWWVKVKKIPKDWYSAKAEINGSANFAHAIYAALINSGVLPAQINDASFRKAADTLFAEKLGGSGEISNPSETQKLIDEYLSHCGGLIGKDSNGNLTLILIRDDYNFDTLPVFDESKIISLDSFERSNYSEGVNEIVIKYRPQGATEDDSISVQDLASIQAQGNVVSQSITYRFIDTALNAQRVGMRDLRQRSAPLAKVTLKTNRQGSTLTTGNVFRLSWREHGFADVVFRIFSIDYGKLTDNQITITAVEDVFGLPESSYLGDQGSGWVDPIQPPAILNPRKMYSAGYWELATTVNRSEFEFFDETTAFLIAMVGEQTTFTQNWDMWTRVGGAAYQYDTTGDFVPTAKLAQSISKMDTKISLKDLSRGVNAENSSPFVYIDDECIRIDSIDINTGQATIARGCLDSVPAIHNVDALVWFVSNRVTPSFTEYVKGTTLSIKALSRTTLGVLDINKAPADSITLSGRFNAPYPPANFKINDEYFPDAISSPVVLSWAHRDRTQQLVEPVIDTSKGNIGPETGVTYTAVLKNASNQVLETKANIAGTSVAFTYDYTGAASVELYSVRGGVQSLQKQTHSLNIKLDERTSVFEEFTPDAMMDWRQIFSGNYVDKFSGKTWETTGPLTRARTMFDGIGCTVTGSTVALLKNVALNQSSWSICFYLNDTNTPNSGKYLSIAKAGSASGDYSNYFDVVVLNASQLVTRFILNGVNNQDKWLISPKVKNAPIMITVVFDSEVLTIWKNDIKQSSLATDGIGVDLVDIRLCSGGTSANDGFSFVGVSGNMAQFNRALTQAEIEEIWQKSTM